MMYNSPVVGYEYYNGKIKMNEHSPLMVQVASYCFLNEGVDVSVIAYYNSDEDFDKDESDYHVIIDQDGKKLNNDVVWTRPPTREEVKKYYLNRKTE